MDEAGWRIGLLPTRKYRFRLDGNYLVVMMAFVPLPAVLVALWWLAE